MPEKELHDASVREAGDGAKELHDAYAAIRHRARETAGTPSDILPRVAAHYAIYQDSQGNHSFPMIALHGALWGKNFFEVTGQLGTIVSYRYFYDAQEKTKRHGMLNAFSEGFKTVNREVFIDTYTNYYFTKEYGRHPEASHFIQADLLGGLNAVHAAARGAPLDDGARREVFQLALRHEQEVTVAPGVAAELAKFDCPILRALCMKPVVRFTYFPTGRRFFFSDFSNTEERIGKALRSFDLAAAQGWGRVEAAMSAY